MAKVVTAPAAEPIRMWHLLTHTSGLTYGFHHHGAVDELYRAAGFEWGSPPGLDLAGCCAAWAELPLLFQPGTEWNYGHSTDVLGRVIEVISGQPLDEFLAARVLGPLGMAETGFHAPGGRPRPPRRALRPAIRRPAARAAAPPPRRRSARPRTSPAAAGWSRPPATTRASRACCASGGELDGVRLLGPRTLRLMTANQLPGHADLEAFGRPLFAETTFDGVGFGLGFSVVEDPIAARYTSSRGEFGWGGAASTAFWVDREERMEVQFFTQLLPSSTHPIRSQLHQLVHQALID